MFKESKKLIISLIILSFIIAFPYIISDIRELEIKSKGEYNNPFEKINLEAKSAYVFDIIREEAIFGLNPNVQLPVASLAKIMTAIVAREQVPGETVITISKDAIKTEGDDDLLVNEKWLLSDLINFVLTKSSNDAAYAIAANLEQILITDREFNKAPLFSEKFPKFVYLMNKKAKELNLKQTYFLNETGLDISESLSGAYSSASDLTSMMRYVIANKPEIFEATTYESISLYSLNYGEHRIDNSNEYVGRIPLIIASKTGFTNLAGGNLAIIFDAGFSHPVVIVVMGSTIDGRFFDMQKLINATFEWLQQK